MNNTKLITALVSAVLALTLAGCGGSSTNSPPTVAPPPTTTDVVSVGTISGFGSVITNGVHYDTSSCTVTLDGAPATLSQLRVGMVVSIQGTVNDASGAASASQIQFVDDAEGMITSMDRASNRFVVLGRTVLVDELTIFDNATFDTLGVGNMVQVSGLLRSQERIQATHIERKANMYAAGMENQVKGEINSLDTSLQRFNIGTQSCDYSAAMLELGGETLADGLYVEVASNSALMNGIMLVDRIQTRDRNRDRDQNRDRLCDSGCVFDLEGYVTRFNSPTDFDVDGIAVSTTDSTVYINGTVDNLVIDANVGVAGTLDASGILVADTIVFRIPSLVQIEADVESIDADNASIVLLGVTVANNEFTMFRDNSDIDVREFGLDDLAVGDRVEIRGHMDGETLVAAVLERDDADDSVTLKALVETAAQPNLTMLGTMVTSNQDTVFHNEANEIIDADSFFALVTTDSVVKAEGAYDGSSILASTLFLRDCDENCL